MEQSIREKTLSSAFQSNYIARAAGCTPVRRWYEVGKETWKALGQGMSHRNV